MSRPFHRLPSFIKFSLLLILAMAGIAGSAHAATSANKGYNLLTTGSNRNTWGIVQNNNFNIIDRNIAGRIEIDVSGSSNITVPSNNAQYLYHKLTGVLTGNIQYVLPDTGGLYVIQNATTGAFTLTIDNVLAGTGVSVPQGTAMLVYSNADDNTVTSAITYITGVLLPSNNLSDVSAPGTAFANIKQAATESASGACELATTGEATTGTDTTRCVTSAGVTANVTAAIAAQVPGGIPAGSVFFFAGSTAPVGYVEGYGQALSRTTYSDLFASVGTIYGSGDGTTTFNAPDCRGRLIAGEDDMGGTAASRLVNDVSGGIDGSTLGATGGERKHTLNSSEIPPLTVSIPAQTNRAFGSGSTTLASTTSNTTMSGTVNGGGQAFNVVPPAMIMKCIVKY